MTTELSFENTPTAVTAINPASQASLRNPADSVLLRYIRNPPKTAIAESRSDRPIMLVTDSVRTGWTAQSAATKKAVPFPGLRPAGLRTSGLRRAKLCGPSPGLRTSGLLTFGLRSFGLRRAKLCESMAAELCSAQSGPAESEER